MKKIMSLIISGMMMLSMVGCGSNKVLQEQIDIFESVKTQEEKIDSIDDYCYSIKAGETKIYYTGLIREPGTFINGFNVSNLKGIDLIVFEVVIDEELYHQFKRDVVEIGVKEAREKYGISELIETMTIVNIEQQKIINSIDKNVSLQCRIVTDENYNEYESLVLSIYEGEVEIDLFK